MGFDQALGLALVMLAGVLIGSAGWPIKIMRSFQYEHWALVCWTTGLVVLPWATVFWGAPHAIATYQSIPATVFLKANLFSLSWGIANVLICLCLVRIGFSLTLGLATGIGLPTGVLLPMFFKGSGLFLDAPTPVSAAGGVILTGVVVLIAAVGFVARAGFGRDAHTSQADSAKTKCNGGFTGGLVMVVIAGLLQAGLSFAFVYSQGPIIEAFRSQGASAWTANVAVWAVTLPGGALVCILHPAYLVNRTGSWGVLLRHPGECALSALIGLTFFLFVVSLGEGMRLMGPLGASIGFGVYQAFQILAGQAVGVIAGEWRGVHGKPCRQMGVGVGLLCLGVLVLAVAQQL